MPEIVLLCSVHKENGRCNSSELVQILENLKPDVLFQEVPYFEHLERSPLGSANILEIRAITEYLKYHNLHQVPVDTLGVSAVEDDGFSEVIDFMSRTSADFRRVWDDNRSMGYTGGFEFLNSRSGDRVFQRSDFVVTKVLEQLNDGRLMTAYLHWKAHNAKRDDAMLSNVYAFCRRTKFQTGVFMFGAGHRISLIRKIRTAKMREEVRVDWKLDFRRNRSKGMSA